MDACIGLVEQGDLRPTAPRIAERAGVSVRSVFQHFDDLPSLYLAVIERIAARLAVLVEPIDAGLPLDERVERFAGQRATFLEALTPFRVAANVHGPFAPEVRRAVSAGAARLRTEVERTFAPELAGVPPAGCRPLVDALATVSSWATWETLRSECDNDIDEARAAVVRLLRAVLADAAST